MQFLATLFWNWIKDSQFHKTAASAAAGTSIGMLTVIGVLEQKIETVKADVRAEVSDTLHRVEQLQKDFVSRNNLIDERFDTVSDHYRYLRGAIDVTNQNVLNLSHELKRNK